VRDLLVPALASFRNREAAFALAVFIARFWSISEKHRSSTSSRPGHIPGTFALDRRKLVEHPDLGLTEKQIRSAIGTLEEVGFLTRYFTSGSTHMQTDEGELHRKPIIFQFGSDYARMFSAANKRAAARRGGHSGERRVIPPSQPSRASTELPEARRPAPAARAAAHRLLSEPPLKGPKGIAASESSVHMGPLVKESGLPAEASESSAKLEAALARFAEGFRQSRGG
jgi:hypothetical protein